MVSTSRDGGCGVLLLCIKVISPSFCKHVLCVSEKPFHHFNLVLPAASVK